MGYAAVLWSPHLPSPMMDVLSEATSTVRVNMANPIGGETLRELLEAPVIFLLFSAETEAELMTAGRRDDALDAEGAARGGSLGPPGARAGRAPLIEPPLAPLLGGAQQGSFTCANISLVMEHVALKKSTILVPVLETDPSAGPSSFFDLSRFPAGTGGGGDGGDGVREDASEGYFRSYPGLPVPSPRELVSRLFRFNFIIYSGDEDQSQLLERAVYGAIRTPGRCACHNVPQHDVFLSYRRGRFDPVVDAMFSKIDTLSPTFFDKTCIPAGSDWKDVFSRQIAGSAVVFVLFEESVFAEIAGRVESAQADNVLLEWEIALSLHETGRAIACPLLVTHGAREDRDSGGTGRGERALARIRGAVAARAALQRVREKKLRADVGEWDCPFRASDAFSWGDDDGSNLGGSIGGRSRSGGRSGGGKSSARDRAGASDFEDDGGGGSTIDRAVLGGSRGGVTAGEPPISWSERGRKSSRSNRIAHWSDADGDSDAFDADREASREASRGAAAAAALTPRDDPVASTRAHLLELVSRIPADVPNAEHKSEEPGGFSVEHAIPVKPAKSVAEAIVEIWADRGFEVDADGGGARVVEEIAEELGTFAKDVQGNVLRRRKIMRKIMSHKAWAAVAAGGALTATFACVHCHCC